MLHTKGTTTRAAKHDDTFRFKCHQCGGIFASPDTGGTGYAVDREDRLICYACCGLNDAAELRNMKPGDRTVHYLDGRDMVTNWPGTLQIKPYSVKHGRHNIGRTRVDVWFMFEGKPFHGVNIGDNQLLRIRAVKS